MADTAATTSAVSASVPSTPKKAKNMKKSGPPKASHPATAVMVNNAIQHLKERGGSSLQAIKKYISATYKIDAEKLSSYIKKYLKSAVVSGALVQTKGKGASGSFKLASTAVTKSDKVSKSKPKKAAKSPAKPKAKTASKPAAKKAAKKPIATKTRKAPVEKKVAEVKAKSPSKAKKTAKTPTKKPKSPKQKITKPKTSRAAKKASPKRK